ncbi:PPIases accelerate the folding of proteins. It catalyzes the cis-trans isomerization of proline imidic peptide bonds in oligopeptides (By similarity) [Seminavis robusta]|uniref:PPIases accelerate the folding of proteins. It catalyzes the cis-trans isomerization of proline imidic peptide bonds in oligopeptides By similarity n=1 Tax=Seminavis robusta TaxID=568900 RepID=A0A9N8DVY0_9STRA|nr:PPIases accelerate the folding of proteins. It catalyzes the cis-trans isomerization of proline imidic peptide bonds in oligopeptides (By similarity) [Seminavis robusta]|eukprot:Sro392_g133330.1 PPIases accelerate the folding of proteins. It catalyzes the cis-trans isomerization of proline imidic peptide bonds in oligopeptides (By similarity) (317) ;mRNA; f:20079-21029
MVSMQRTGSSTPSSTQLAGYLPVGILLLLLCALVPYVLEDHYYHRDSTLHHIDAAMIGKKKVMDKQPISDVQKKETPEEPKTEGEADESESIQCPYKSIDDLTEEEHHPVKGKRHTVTPPQGGSLHLVCCQTTKGPVNALVHEKWAPLGAKHFLDMVKSDYFSSTVPLMRCVKGFICQFGLNGDPKLNKMWRHGFPDDPNWLPEGPTNRKNEDGVFRFAHGYLAYAGGGKNSRGNQFIVALKPNQKLAGGSPWEVPWGELVGEHSFDTFSKVYTGYGEKGPPQGKLSNQGVTEELKQQFPLLDYVTGCRIVDERVE